jgi:hypothetical protein
VGKFLVTQAYNFVKEKSSKNESNCKENNGTHIITKLKIQRRQESQAAPAVTTADQSTAE